MFIQRLILAVFTVVSPILTTSSTSSQDIHKICPRMYTRPFRGYIPEGNLTAGTFKEVPEATGAHDCVIACCQDKQCNVAFLTLDKCYHIYCKTDELCKPTLSPNPDTADDITMVLVKPVSEESWQDVLSPQEYSTTQLDREMYNALNNNRRLQDIYKDLVIGGGNSYDLGCTYGIDGTCLPNEICVQNHPKSRAGTCTCQSPFARNRQGDCVLDVSSARARPPDVLTEHVIDVTNKTMAVTRRHLAVTAKNLEVRLPEDEVTLIATVTPDDANEDEKYQYAWTSLQQPPGSTAVKHQNGGQLQLSKLSEGLYTFKVGAGNTFAYGETFVNVTVLPPSRINQPPKVVITPANQTIKQPNNAAVLDASSSTDDDGIVSWHWELQQGPLGTTFLHVAKSLLFCTSSDL